MWFADLDAGWKFATGVLTLLGGVMTYLTVRAKAKVRAAELAAIAEREKAAAMQAERDALRIESEKVFGRMEGIADRAEEREKEIAALYAEQALELKECQIKGAMQEAELKTLRATKEQSSG